MKCIEKECPFFEYNFGSSAEFNIRSARCAATKEYMWNFSYCSLEEKLKKHTENWNFLQNFIKDK